MSFADPLWEFVLEDYDDEEASRRGKFERSRGRKAETKPSSGSWGFGSLSYPKTSKKGDGVEYRDDKEDGFWDVISGAPPAATVRKRSKSYSGRTKNNKGRGLLSKKSILKTNKSQPLTRSQSSEMHHNDKQTNITKRRLSWNQSTKSPESVSRHSTRKFDVKQKTSANRQDSVRKYSESEVCDSSFDPVDFIFQIADSLDPWGVESSVASMSEIDSHDEIGTDDDGGDGNSIITGRFTEESLSHAEYVESQESQLFETKSSKSLGQSPIHMRNKRSNGKLESLLDQQLPDPTRFDTKRYPYHSKQTTEERSDYSTEIRLRVNPVGNTISEEVFKKNANGFENGEQVVRKSQIWNRERYPIDEEPYDVSDDIQSSQSFEGILKKQGIVTREREINSSNERKRPSFPELRIPMDVRIEDKGDSSIPDTNRKNIDSNKAPNALKKAVCGLKKGCQGDLINRSGKSDSAEIFPSSRIIIDGEQHLITGPNSDQMKGLMGASSGLLIGSKGPQSAFAYDYDSKMNMDVSYSKPNQKPRSSLSVRKLGNPPLMSPDSENIVVQIEASIVSETDCIIRQGLWWGNAEPSFPNTPGITLVGKVYGMKQMTGKMHGLNPMHSVLSLVKWGGNARFMTIHPNQLVRVPEGLDPAQVACLPECYLSAFQVLLGGQTGNSRYRESSMKGKSILILGCMTNNMGKAIIELAFNAGVANIYATAKKKHWKTLISYGVIPFSPDPMEWIQRIAGTMDLVLAPNGNLREDVSPVHFRALRPRYGQLIICGHRIVGNDIPIEAWKRDHRLPMLACGKNKALQKILRNSVSYDVYKEWGKNLDLCKRDLSHLLGLLKRKAIKPEVLDRIPLNKVAKAQELLEKKRLPGFLVCEPWMKSKKDAVYL